MKVGEDDVLSIDTVLSCVRVIAEETACLPFELFKPEADGTNVEAAIEHPLYNLMRWSQNEEMTAFDFRMWLMVDVLIRGRAYAQIIRDGKGQVLSLWPLNARDVRPYRATKTEKGLIEGQIYYEYYNRGVVGAPRIILKKQDVLKIQLMGHGGLLGLSMVELQKESLGASKAATEFSSEFFANGGATSGVLEIEAELSEVAYQRLKKDWKEAHTGTGKRHGTPILEAGTKFTPFALNHEETQLLETRKFQRSTISGLWRVPAHLINDLESATYSNIEQQDLGFAKHCLRPWLTNWEQNCQLSLLTDAERKQGYFFRHNTRDLLRGDFPSRAIAYSSLVNVGIMSPNDCRRMEDMNSYEGGDQYLVNGTLRDINKEPVAPQPFNPNAPQTPPAPAPVVPPPISPKKKNKED